MSFDFSIPYKKYPRKEGKSVGLKKLEKTIISETDYLRFCKAVENYADLMAIRSTELKYIKMWSSFCNQWEDYETREDFPELQEATW